jgi:DNA-binding MarR family transcriptional regulator
VAEAPSPGRIWEQLVDVVMDSRHDGPRRVADAVGLPYSRIRALKQLAEGERTMGELARALDIDSSAATGTVNALEERGLAVRSPHPDSRRVRIVAITPAGRELLRRSREIELPVPAAMERLSEDDRRALAAILQRMRGEQ